MRRPPRLSPYWAILSVRPARVSPALDRTELGTPWELAASSPAAFPCRPTEHLARARENSRISLGYVASVFAMPQASLADVQVEPDAPTVASTVGHNPTDATPPLRGTGGTSVAAITRPTRDLFGPCHRLGDPFLGELWGHGCGNPGLHVVARRLATTCLTHICNLGGEARERRRVCRLPATA
jgi:hypothetical protein